MKSHIIIRPQSQAKFELGDLVTAEFEDGLIVLLVRSWMRGGLEFEGVLLLKTTSKWQFKVGEVVGSLDTQSYEKFQHELKLYNG